MFGGFCNEEKREKTACLAGAVHSGSEEYDLNKGSVTVETKDNGNTYVTQANTETTDHLDTTGVTITSNGEQTSNTITVNTADNQTTNVTLQDVNIKEDQWSGGAAMTINGKGDTEIELNGDNTLISGNYHAGLEKAGDVSQGSLTIKDDKNNDGSDKKKEYGYSTGGDTGTLIAAGGYDGAGIGGRKKKDGEESDACASTSDITITGGQIKAGSLIETKEEYDQPEYSGAGIGGATGHGNATNITITGNADVSAAGGYYAAGIGGGDDGVGKNIRITDHADVTAYGGNQGAGIGGGPYRGGSVEISGNAKVFAKGANCGAGIGSGADGGYSKKADTSVTISDNANVTAIGSYGGAAIGTGKGCTEGKTTINITGGTVTAIGGESTVRYVNGHCYKDLTSAIGGSHNYGGSDSVQDVTVTINGTTGNTTVNASCWLDQKSAISTGDGAADIIGYDEDGKSPFGEDGSVIVRMYNHGSYTRTGYGPFSKSEGDLKSYNLGDLYQVVHNRKYMEEHPEIVDDFNKLENSDLHDWQLVDKVAPTLEKEGYADYVCRIDKCGQTKRVVLPKLTPEESGSVETREVGVIFWDAAAQAAPAALQGKVLSADEKTATAEKAQVESLLADKANWKLAEDVGDLMIHPAADAAGTVYEQAVKASGCQYYVIANVTAQ